MCNLFLSAYNSLQAIVYNLPGCNIISLSSYNISFLDIIYLGVINISLGVIYISLGMTSLLAGCNLFFSLAV